MQADPRQQKISALIGALVRTEDGLAFLRDTLDTHGIGTTRQIEKMQFPEICDPARLQAARIGVFLDVETTGLDHSKDEVIQLAMRRFRYDDQGILSLGDQFDRLRDPNSEITAEITRLTGIAQADVKGKAIADSEIAAFIAGSDRIVCHNAGFDRKFVERCFPKAGFDRMQFNCSLEEIDWMSRGANGRSLELLALKAGFSYGAHNALNDINAMPYILSQAHPDDPAQGTAFADMLRKGAEKTIMIIAQNSSFNVKDHLKEAGYRWSPDGVDAAGHAKCWWTTIPDQPELLAEQAEFLKTQIYNRDVELPAFKIGAEQRYSARPPEERITFRTAEARKVTDIMRQINNVHDDYARLEL